MTAEQLRKTVIEARRDELLTVGEYADLLRCSTKTIYRRIWAGKQPGAVRLGGQWRIDFSVAANAQRPRRYDARSA